MKNIFKLITCILTLFLSCSKERKIVSKLQSAGNGTEQAAAPYLTSDNNGNVILCWTSKSSADSNYVVKYAVYNPEKHQLSDTVRVTPSSGTGVSGESINKVAFKKDGTVISVYTKKFPNEKNPWAGAIFYSTSKDGKAWTSQRFISSDTSHSYGRGFFDVATLKNGEVAAIWLDSRYGNSIEGSALFFTKTDKNGFKKDSCINKNTCECCRTDLLNDANGNLHIAYRSILFPPALLGKQARDMVYQTSLNQGKTFSKPQAISEDNWAIEGCPHTGPSLVSAGKTIEAVWFTAAGREGIYRNASSTPGRKFQKKSLVSAEGRHPQAVALAENQLAVVYEEPLQAQKGGHENHNAMKQHNSSPKSKIILNILSENAGSRIVEITDGTHADHHAVLIPVKGGLLIAWTRDEGTKTQVLYTKAEF